MYSIDAFPGRTISVKGKSYLYFGGTSYLGLQTDSEFKQIFINNIEKYGTNYSASRKANVQISIYDSAEKKLATIVGSEACVTLSSGYLAGQVVSKTLKTKDNKFFYAPNTHVALHTENEHSYDSIEKLSEAIENHLKSGNNRSPVLFIDSMESLEKSYPNFEDLKDLPLQELIIVIDDSHGIGILGTNGGGAYESIQKLNPKEVILCASLGKGFGVQAGAVFGSKRRIEKIMTTEFFGGGSPAMPASMGTFIDAEKIYSKKRERLKEHIETFTHALNDPNQFTWIKGHSAFSFSNPDLIPFLKENEIVVTNFHYPNEEGALVSRLVISAHHTEADIHQLTKTLNSFNC